MKKKSIAVVLALVLLVCCAVGGVLAWLTDTTGPVKNTFTVGNVDITLEETDATVAEDGSAAKEFKMVPGQTITKDPKVTVLGGSEACWLFVEVEESETLDSYITYTVDNTVWTALPGEEGVYYREVSASDDDQPFYVLTGNQVTVNTGVTKTMMDDLNKDGAVQPTLTFTAYACQKANFDTAAAAWAEVGA